MASDLGRTQRPLCLALALCAAACGDDSPGSGPCAGATCPPGAGSAAGLAGSAGSDAAGSGSGQAGAPGQAGSGPSQPTGPVTSRLDLLFMVDDSGSMREEQSSLRNGFPRLLAALTSGDVGQDGTREFAPATSLHIGVVSSDLGSVGIDAIDKCTGIGDAARLQHAPTIDPEVLGCNAQYPAFLSFEAGGDQAATARDFACIATLGTDGCGFEQQLEVALKALWPAEDPSLTFLVDPVTMFGGEGQGGLAGDNAGFARSDAAAPSALAIVIVSDEEDCSYAHSGFLRPPQLLDPNVPADVALQMQGLNVRCHGNPGSLHPTQRYLDGLKQLRAGSERLVSLSAIVGVPPETVVDVADDYWTYPSERAALYQRIRSHPSMQPTIDTKDTPSPDDDILFPSCETPAGRAYPPNRIVDVAESFGAGGIVQSICQEDFGPAMDRVARTIAHSLGG